MEYAGMACGRRDVCRFSPMPDIHIEIVGMTCEHCVRAVRKRLASMPGVVVQDVTIGSADIHHDETKTLLSDIEDAISDEGYTVDTVVSREG
jgi:copper chaperone CopZ